MGVGRKPPVGAHYGLRDWLVQRATAAVMTVAILVLAAALLVCRPDGFEAWRDFVLTGWVRLLLLLTVVSIVWHAFIGARDILMDYIKHDMFRLFKAVSVSVYLFVCLLWAADILL